MGRVHLLVRFNSRKGMKRLELCQGRVCLGTEQPHMAETYRARERWQRMGTEGRSPIPHLRPESSGSEA